MPRFRPKPWMVLTTVLVLLVVAFFSTFYVIGGRQGTVVENLAGSAAAPAVSGANGFAVGVRDFFDRLFGARKIDKEYQEMKVEIQRLKTANQLMADLQQENEQLNKLLVFKEQYPDFNYMPASVIGKEPGSWFINFTLDRGSDNGVKKGDTVVNEFGLVGTIVGVGHNWCKVMAIIDRQCSVSVIIERTRDYGVVDGGGELQSGKPACVITDLPYESSVEPGDIVLSTDLGGYFPKGLAVGEVTLVNRDQQQNSYAEMVPYVDFAHIEHVLIITGKKVPTAEEINKEEEAQKNQEAPN